MSYKHQLYASVIRSDVMFENTFDTELCEHVAHQEVGQGGAKRTMNASHDCRDMSRVKSG